MEKVNPFVLYEVMNKIDSATLALQYAAYLESIDFQLEAIANQQGMRKEFLILKEKAWGRFGWSCCIN